MLIFVVSRKQLSTRLRASIVVGTLVVIELVSNLLIGLTGGVALAAAFALVMAALLLGRRAMIVTLAVLVIGSLGILVALASGLITGPPPAESNMSDPVVWLRITLVSVAVWTLIGFSVLFVVNTIETNLARREQALVKLQRESAERKSAEKARLDAELMAAEAQKLDAVGRLAAGIAHDFSNALTVIELWISLLKESDLDSDQQEGISAIEGASRHGTQLARQLLTFARKDVHNPQYLAIDEIARSTTATLQRALDTDIKLNVDARSNAAVHADESQMQQLLFNLIFNARDAISGGGTISVSTRSATASDLERFDLDGSGDAQWALLVVADDGSGIAEEDMGRILEPFYSTKAPGKGTGLGLSIVFSIVRRSGGHLKIESEVGVGTTISIIFPATDLALLSTMDTNESQQDDLLDMRIVVLEDDPVAGELINSILQRYGARTVYCANGNEAAAAIVNDSQPFDLLCTDAVFPGVKLSDIISKAEQQSPGIRVLVCSGYLPDEIAIEGIESGRYGFLSKPFNAPQLIRAIRRVVGDG